MGIGEFESGKAESENKIPNPQLYEISIIVYLKYANGDIIPNRVFSSVSPLVPRDAF